MLIFNNLGEMQPYYNKETKTYEFMKDGSRMDVMFEFNFNINSNILAGDIKAGDINAGNINAWDINAEDITAGAINARDIKAWDINARDIKARDINALDINAEDIQFYAFCCVYGDIKCKSIKGKRENSKYFCLDGKVLIEP